MTIGLFFLAWLAIGILIAAVLIRYADMPVSEDGLIAAAIIAWPASLVFFLAAGLTGLAKTLARRLPKENNWR